MLTTLNGQNAFQRLIIASLHNDDQLKNASLDCISGLTRGNIANFTTSSEWHELYIKNPGVANDVGKLIRDKLNTYVWSLCYFYFDTHLLFLIYVVLFMLLYVNGWVVFIENKSVDCSLCRIFVFNEVFEFRYFVWIGILKIE